MTVGKTSELRTGLMTTTGFRLVDQVDTEEEGAP